MTNSPNEAPCIEDSDFSLYAWGYFKYNITIGLGNSPGYQLLQIIADSKLTYD